MCGIVGYVGNKPAANILINGLKALEYRGYDSAGIALLENGKIKVFKEKGRVKELEEKNTFEVKSNIGIAHTRWATHGVPSKINAHPHLDNKGIFGVVHNGIIENYLELKEFLIKNGYEFKSQTDTEVIPNLIHYYYTKTNNVAEAFRKAIKELRGSYAVLLLTPLVEGIYVAKLGSPLVIGKGEKENFIASDIPAVLEYTKEFYFINDQEMAYVDKNEVIFYDKDFKKIRKDIKVIDWDKRAADKNGYEDYMLKEIFEQPRAINDTLAGRIIKGQKSNFMDLDISKKEIEAINKIYIVACGTAMHAGLVGKMAIEKLTNILTIVDIASEFRYNSLIIDNKTLCIFVSQSGETADTIAALKLAKKMGAKTITVTNVIGSSITRETDYTILTHAGPEIAVASTKAYVSQVVTLVSLAIFLAETLEIKKEIIEDLKNDLGKLPELIQNILEDTDEYKKLARDLAKEKDVFYIGRGMDYNTALEGSLKLKEISYIHSEAYPAGELKHGPIALIEKGTVVVGIITNEETGDKTFSNLQEVISRGAKVLVVSNTNITNKEVKVLPIPKINYLLSSVLAIVPLQLLAYYIAKEKGLDVDKPRNLAKSVTVE